jgi:hypothetical protein
MVGEGRRVGKGRAGERATRRHGDGANGRRPVGRKTRRAHGADFTLQQFRAGFEPRRGHGSLDDAPAFETHALRQLLLMPCPRRGSKPARNRFNG